MEEAENTVARWFADRPEVKEWQEKTQEYATFFGEVKTLMGRTRPLTAIRKLKGHHAAMRAAINTPVQGGAADIVMAAMLKIENSPRLMEIGWHMLLQVHDEVICEGPEEHAEEALAIIKSLMAKPFENDLLVALPVDGSVGHSWYEAK